MAPLSGDGSYLGVLGAGVATVAALQSLEGPGTPPLSQSMGILLARLREFSSHCFASGIDSTL